MSDHKFVQEHGESNPFLNYSQVGNGNTKKYMWQNDDNLDLQSSGESVEV